jgi:hypothetical protein
LFEAVKRFKQYLQIIQPSITWYETIEMGRQPMRLWFPGVIVSLGLSLAAGVAPAWAQFSDAQVGAFVEALRQAAPQTGRQDDGLYSEWQVQAQNIPRWSRLCIKRELTPAQFDASPATARQVITCVIRDVLRDEYRASGNNQGLAVRRAAGWWMTGDPTRYASGDTAIYTQKVLNFYQQNLSKKPVTTTPDAPEKPTPTAQTPARQSNTPYDRYMRAGYDANRRKEHQTALLYFRRALDERPNDTYATQAIRNVENYLNPNRPASSAPKPSPSPAGTAASITQQQALELINRWLQSKGEIFAPPFNQYRVGELTTGELLLSLVRPDGILQWLKDNQAYYRYGVQKVNSVERFVSSRDRATIEVQVTEDRTLYLNGAIDPRRTDFSAHQVRYSLELVDGKWKIADYKTVDGSLLEREISNTATSGGVR